MSIKTERLLIRAKKLTKKGKDIAVSIIRNHRLWEVFLVEKLNFKWDEVHDLAEELEHIKSKKLTEQLDAFLEFPNNVSTSNGLKYFLSH